MRRVLALALLLGSCDAERHRVSLDFGNPESVSSGFVCRGDNLVLLLWRGLVGDEVRVSFVIDFISLGGVPSCFAPQLFDWCTEEGHSCAPMLQHRTCIDLDPISRVGVDAKTIIEAFGAQLAGKVVTGDAPDEPVLVRAVGTAQTCAELAAAPSFDPARLIGCAFSCPVQLDSADEVALGLPTLQPRCEDAVVVCAGDRLELPETSP